MLKLHHLLEQEADELKRLLGAKAGVVGEQPAEVADNAARATCARLKRDMASRRLHEANVSTSEVCVRASERACVRASEPAFWWRLSSCSLILFVFGVPLSPNLGNSSVVTSTFIHACRARARMVCANCTVYTSRTLVGR